MDAYQSNKEAKSCSVEGCEKRSISCVSSVFTKLKNQNNGKIRAQKFEFQITKHCDK